MAEVFFQSACGRIEGRFHRSENPTAPLALVLPPNPTQGGSMNNKVTYALFQSFAALGFSVLRINYRGVGASQGAIDGTGAGELIDAIAALDWLQGLDSDANKCWIAGYSFGAWIAAQVLMRRPEIEGFVFATPPVNVHDFNFLTPCPSSGVVVQGAEDEYVDEAAVARLVEQLNENTAVNVAYNVLPKTDHLYTGKLKELYDSIIETVPSLKLNKMKRGKKFAKAIIPNDDY